MRKYYGQQIMENLKNILLEYQKTYHLTNKEMAKKCKMSGSEYDKIIYAKNYGKYGCRIDTICRISINLGIDIDTLLAIDTEKE